ncbi:MAG: glycoside hydrolase, partial [Treponema sp.]|nr:glycoside hydrolase [Treponema sp.]
MMYRKLRGLFLFSLALVSAALYAQTKFFWEQPAPFSTVEGNFPITAFNNDYGIVAWQEPSPRPGSTGGGSINIAMAVKLPGQPWEQRGVIGGPYVYSGSEPSILSAVIDDHNRILIAVAASAVQTEILVSEDQGRTFEHFRLDSGTQSSVAPKIAVASDGSYLLFVTRGNQTSLSLYYSRSGDGRSWTPFQPFVTELGMQLNFLPSHVSFGGREYVVFQSFTGSSETIPTFQLFIKSSDDAGLSWTPARRFTQFRDPFMNTAESADNFDNQRPQLSIQDNSLFLVWERRFRTNMPQIYAARVNTDGSIAGPPERINSTNSYCNYPVAFNYNGSTMILWFDNRQGSNRIYMARRAGIIWENTDLSGSTGDATFGRPITDNDGLFIFWQNNARQGTAKIYYISPDTTVSPVRITAKNFTPGRRTRGDKVQVSWNIPADSSGIQGFSYSWSQDENTEPEKTIQLYNSGSAPSLEEAATEDGTWYLTVIAQDYAGNWSPPSRIAYIRDTTPPPAAAIIQPALDAQGYLASNTFTLQWNAPPASDIQGYAWNLDYLDTSGAFIGMDN